MLAADSFDEQVDCGHGRVELPHCSVEAGQGLLTKAPRGRVEERGAHPGPALP